jgi:hypothetical protein
MTWYDLDSFQKFRGPNDKPQLFKVSEATISRELKAKMVTRLNLVVEICLAK